MKRNSYILDWLNNEGRFIFWMVILNLAAINVNYRIALRSYYSFYREFLIFARDALLIVLYVMVLDILIYSLCRKHSLIQKSLKCFFLAINICLFLIDISALYFFRYPFNYVMFEVLAVSTIKEANEFIYVYLLDTKFWFLLILIALVIFVAFKTFTLIQSRKSIYGAIMLFILGFSMFAQVREVRLHKGIMRLKSSIALYRLYDFVHRTIQSTGGGGLSVRRANQK